MRLDSKTRVLEISHLVYLRLVALAPVVNMTQKFLEAGVSSSPQTNRLD